MAIKTNMKSLQPRRQVYKREIQLLSRGFSAPQAWPDGKITVFPWDSDIDAFIMEQTKKEHGNLLYDIISKVCNLNGASVDQFVWGEVNMVLLLSRALQFNGIVEYNSYCPFCSSTAKETIKIPDELSPVGQKEVGYPGYDEVTLPDCGDVVRIRPLLVKDQKKIEDRAKDVLWQGYTERHLSIFLPVIAVGGGPIESLEEVAQWYNALTPNDARFLEEQESDLMPHLDNRIPHKCDKCQRNFNHILTFDQEFFRSRSRGRTTPPLEKDVSVSVGGQGVSDKPA
jgi:hypothetical protein